MRDECDLDERERSRLEDVVDRLTQRYLPAKRPDLRVVQGERED